MERIKIGEIVGAIGIKGEFKVYDFGDDLGRYSGFEYVYIESEKMIIANSRVQKNTAVLLVEGVSDRNEAEKLRGKSVFIDDSQLPKLPEGVYYIKDLIGFDVISKDGLRVGKLNNILKNTAQPLYEVKNESGKMVYIPGVDEFILDTDLEKKTITVNIIEGLID